MNTHHLRSEQPGPDRLDGRYRLVEPLGRGGTSEVWRGLDERLSRPVAVKILHGRGNDWMRNEAQALALLTHPHIATVYDYGYSQRRHYLVMELVRGVPLAAVLDRGPLPWYAAVRSCAQVASALSVAHARGVVHRDVTPGNIMLTAAGVKLIDFGISALAGDRETTVDGELYGTPPYAAPERLHSSAVAPAVDVFALGVVLYRAVSGCLPWHAHTAEQLVAAQQTVDPADLPAVTGLPDDVGEACMACLARDPADRPSAAELAVLLATTIPGIVELADLPLPAATEPLPMTVAMSRTHSTAPARSRGNRRWGKQAAAALAVPAAAALAWFATGIGPSEAPLPGDAAAPPAAQGPAVQGSLAAPPQEAAGGTSAVPGAAPAPRATPATPGQAKKHAAPAQAKGKASKGGKDGDQNES